jgi:hypothetical protein
MNLPQKKHPPPPRLPTQSYPPAHQQVSTTYAVLYSPSAPCLSQFCASRSLLCFHLLLSQVPSLQTPPPSNLTSSPHRELLKPASQTLRLANPPGSAHLNPLTSLDKPPPSQEAPLRPRNAPPNPSSFCTSKAPFDLPPLPCRPPQPVLAHLVEHLQQVRVGLGSVGPPAPAAVVRVAVGTAAALPGALPVLQEVDADRGALGKVGPVQALQLHLDARLVRAGSLGVYCIIYLYFHFSQIIHAVGFP